MVLAHAHTCTEPQARAVPVSFGKGAEEVMVGCAEGYEKVMICKDGTGREMQPDPPYATGSKSIMESRIGI